MVLVGLIRRKDTGKSLSSVVVKKILLMECKKAGLHNCSARLLLQNNRLFFKFCC